MEKCFMARNPALIHRLFRECRMILFKLSLVRATACEAPSSDFQSARYTPLLPPAVRYSVAIATAKRPADRPEQMTTRGDWRWQHSTSDNGHFARRKINSLTSKTRGARIRGSFDVGAIFRENFSRKKYRHSVVGRVLRMFDSRKKFRAIDERIRFTRGRDIEEQSGTNSRRDYDTWHPLSN